MNYQQLLESLCRQLEQLTDARASALRELASIDQFQLGDPDSMPARTRAEIVRLKLNRLHAQLAELGAAIAAVARAAQAEGVKAA